MLASGITTAFRVLLAVFGVFELLYCGFLLWWARRDPPTGYVGSVLLVALLSGAVGVAALLAALLRSATVFAVMAAFMLAVPVTQAVLRRRHDRDSENLG